MSIIKPLRLAFLALLLAGAVPACATDDGSTDDLSEVDADSTVRPSFQVWKNEAGKFYFHLEAGNGETLLTSQSYTTRTSALHGLLSVLDNGGLTTRYVIKAGADGQQYISLKAANGETIAFSEGYSTKSNANRAVTGFIRNIAAYLAYWDSASGARFQVNQGETGKFSFNLHAANGAIVLHSEAYTTEEAALNGAMSADESGITTSAFTIKAAQSGKYYFTLKAGNGEIVGTSETYATKASATRARDSVISLLKSGAVDLL